MATSNKDVKLTLSVETLGEADIKALQQAVLQLAKGGSDAAPEFQRLADQIDRLGEQNDALQSFRVLNDQVDELAAKQADAAQRATDLKAKLDAQKASVDELAAKQQQANQALLKGQTAYVEAGNAVRQYKAETDAAGKKEAEYAAELGKRVKAQNDARVALIALRDGQRQANAEVSEAVSAQKKLETAYGSAAKQADALDSSLRKQVGALQAAAQAAEDLGVSTGNVAASEAELLASFNEVGAVARRRTAEIEEMAEADRLLAIQERALAALYAESQRELQALTLAQVDAVASVRDYERAKEAATANSTRWQQEADAIVTAAQATQRLARETEIAVTAARELAAQNAFEKAAAESQKLLRAAEYVRFWEQALEEGGTEAQKAAAAAAAAADKIENAFKTVGARSVESLNAEIAELRAAMGTLQAQAASTGQSFSGAFAQGQSRINQLERELRELNGTLTTSDRLAGLFKNSLGQIAAGNLVADGVGYLVNKVKELAAAFVQTIAQSQGLTRALNAIYKDSAITTQQIEFLKRTSLDAGVAVGGIQQAFVKFSASTKSANIPLEQSNALFEALVRAGGTLGLSSEALAGSLEALSQMAAKGTVSMEELRQQLGDRLPGALSLVAKGLGITDGQLIKLVESGGLAARDLFPALTKALQTMQGEVSGITPAWENFKNVLTQTAQSAGDSGWADLLTLAIKTLTAAVGLLVLPLTALGEIIFGLAKSAGILAGALVTLTNPLEALSKVAEDASERQGKLTDAFDKAIGFSDAFGRSVTRTGQATSAATGPMNQLSAVTAETEVGLKALSTATTLAGDTTLDASQKWVQLSTKLAEAYSAQEKLTEAADKNVKAVQIQGEALIELAKLRGDERAVLEASVVAAENNAIALEKSARAHQAELELLRVGQAAFLDNAKARGLSKEEIDKEIVALGGKIAKSEAEAAQARATAEAAQLEIAQRRILRQTYEDNSASVEKYRTALIAAQATAEIYRRGEAEGLFTKEQVVKANRAAAEAQALYNDALRDSTAKIQAVAQVEQAKINVQMAGLGVQQNAYNLMAQSARASGDYAAAIYYEVQAKRVQIQVTQLQAQAKKLEAEAELLAIESERQALIATNALTEAKKKELEARSLNAKAKQIEAGASAEIVRAMEREIATLLSGANARNNDTSGRYSNATAIDQQTASMSRLNAETQRNAELQRMAASDPYKRSAAQIDALSKQGGPVDASYVFDLERRYRAGESFDPSELPAIANALRVARDNARLGGPGSVTLEGRADNDKWVALLSRIMEQVEGAATTTSTRVPKAGAIGTGIPASALPKSTPQSTPQTVNINLGGRTTSINTASASDANALVALLKQLEQAAGTST